MATPKPADFSKGLEGVVAAQTRLSKVLGEEGKLYYCGFPIQDVAAHATFELAIPYPVTGRARLIERKDIKTWRVTVPANGTARTEFTLRLDR